LRALRGLRVYSLFVRCTIGSIISRKGTLNLMTHLILEGSTTSRKAGLNLFLHGNARALVAKSTRKKLLKLGWITIPHPLTITCSILWLIIYERKNSMTRPISKTEIDTFVNHKSKDFYKRGILSLSERW